jgi:5-dehydro-4-deoxyglucarate dehydratase
MEEVAHTDADPPADAMRTLRANLDRGVLSFPLTSFDDSGGLDLEGYREHVRAQVEADPGALFACCGTGEFFSLAEDEYAAAIAVAKEEAAGRCPVVAGVGYGWPQAVRFATAAHEAGADAGLLMPPYLVEAPQAGIVRHVEEVAARTSLPLIVYQRAQVKLSVEAVRALAEVETLVGVKDGHGDLDQLLRLKLVAPDEWLFFNGVATAEMQAHAYSSIGVTAYSSAVHAFAPEIAGAFFRALRGGDHAVTTQLLKGFYLPLVELRDCGTGYAVSLVKAAARLRGARVGPVRAPLTDPGADHTDRLTEIVRAGLAIVGVTDGLR